MADGSIVLDNKDLLQKADMALADLLSGGILQPAQAQKFIRILIDASTVMPMATVVPMKAPKQLIEKIRFGSRILRPAQDATALAEADRSKPEFSKVELDAKEMKAEVRLSNSILEDSIERGELRQTIMQLMGERISVDLDELIVNGDTASSDPYFAQLDGMLKAATSNVVNAGGAATNKGIFRDMLKTMPHPFLRNKAMMRFFTSVNSELDYRDSIADRATAAGDDALKNAAPVGYSGIGLVDVPLFPENLGGGTDQTNMILTDPKNLTVGIWREIRVETDKDISAGVLIIVATLRMDFKYAHEPAVVKATGVKVS